MKSEMPIDLKKIRTKLRSYEHKFTESPHDRDVSGVRFLMGPYYLCLNKLEGAIAHYDWFGGAYPDSIDEPFHTLGQVITKFRQGQEKGVLIGYTILKQKISAIFWGGSGLKLSLPRD